MTCRLEHLSLILDFFEIKRNNPRNQLDDKDIFLSFANRAVNKNRRKENGGKALVPGLVPQVARRLPVRSLFSLISHVLPNQAVDGKKRHSIVNQ